MKKKSFTFYFGSKDDEIHEDLALNCEMVSSIELKQAFALRVIEVEYNATGNPRFDTPVFVNLAEPFEMPS